MSDERRYSEKEVAALIAKATELREAEEAPAPAQEGLTLAEVQRIAMEAGLSPESIRRAAADLASPARPEARGLRRFLGTGFEVAEALYPRAVEPQALAQILADLPDLADIPGSGAPTARGFVYRSDGGYESHTGMKARIEATREGEALRVRVQRSFDGAAGGIYGGLMGGLGLGSGLGVGMGVGLGALHSPLFAFLFACGSLGLAFLASRGLMALIKRDARKRNAKLLEILSELVGNN